MTKSLYTPTGYLLVVTLTKCACGAEQESSELFLIATLHTGSGPITRRTPLHAHTPLRDDLPCGISTLPEKQTPACYQCFLPRDVEPPEDLRAIYPQDGSKVAQARLAVYEANKRKARERNRLLGITEQEARIKRDPAKHAAPIELEDI